MKIENTSPERIEALAAGQREYFRSGATLGEDFRADLRDGYKETKARVRGVVRLVDKGGMPIDTMYEQLRADYGETFFPADIAHPADQLERIAEIAESLKPVYGNPYANGIGEAANQLALELMDQGLDAPAIAARLEEEKRDIRLVALLDTLEYLMKGGRIGKVTATAGTLLQIKPIITFAPDGQLQSIAKVRGRGQVMGKLVDMAVRSCGEHRRYNLAVANGGAPAEMETVRQKLTAALPNYDHLWDGEIDGTLSVYIGDGVLGAAVQVLDEME